MPELWALLSHSGKAQVPSWWPPLPRADTLGLCNRLLPATKSYSHEDERGVLGVIQQDLIQPHLPQRLG